MTSRRLFALLSVLALTACGGSSGGTSATFPGPSSGSGSSSAPSAAITVYAPGTFASTVKAIGAAYEKTGGKATFEVGHTPMQLEQLDKGATPDVWIAASQQHMDIATTKNLVVAGQVQQLAVTTIVVVTAPGNPGKVNALADLGRPGVRLLLAVPDIPIGKATQAAIQKMDAKLGAGFSAKVTKNVVSRELGVKPIVSKVQLGEADAGIVFVTDAKAAPKLGTVTVPDDLNTPVPLSIAPVTAAKNPAAAKAFVEFMVGDAGQAVLKEQGYLSPRQ